jgi:hypothetical protein
MPGGAKGTRTPDPLLAKLIRPVLACVGMAADMGFPNCANVSERLEPHGNGTTEGTTCPHAAAAGRSGSTDVRASLSCAYP